MRFTERAFKGCLLVMVTLVAAGFFWLSSLALLPPAPLFPTPTPPKGIDFPDSRPVPAIR